MRAVASLARKWPRISGLPISLHQSSFKQLAPFTIQARLQISTSNVWKLQDNPEKVTTTSTTTPITAGVHAEGRSQLLPPEEPGSGQLIKEIKGIGQALEGIPQPALLVGLAGTLPYLGTSLGSLYFSWCISKYHGSLGTSFSDKLVFFSAESVETYLPILQTVQVGYGACILSFLGAIHWGFEMSKFGGEVGIKRYIYGAAPALIAWPSILLPLDFALVAHFITFTGVWFADAAAARKGYAPGWYNQYRFLLTFIVCSSILLTLIVSGWLGDPQQATPSSSRLETLREEEVKQLEKDNAEVAAKTKRGKTGKEDKIKRQGDDQETMNDKEKETQEQDKAIGREKQDQDAKDQKEKTKDTKKDDGSKDAKKKDEPDNRDE